MVSHLSFLWSGIKCGSAVVFGQLVYMTVQPALGVSPQEVTVKKDIAYGKRGKQKLDLFIPASASAANPAPVLVFFHGGGWTAGSKDNYRKFAKLVAQAGYVVAVPNYRLYPSVRFPTFVEDAALAVKWIEDNVADSGGDPSHLILSGHSAGAHISSLVTFDPRYLETVGGDASSIRGFIGLSGPYAVLPAEVPPIKDIFGDSATCTTTMPITFVSPDHPPVLLLHGAKDWLVPTDQSRQMENAINEASGTVELQIFPDYKHIDIMPGFRLPQKDDHVLEKIIGFVKAVTP